MKKLGIVFLISFVWSLFLAWLRGGYISILTLTGLPLSSFIGFIVYGLITTLALEKYRNTTFSGYIVLLVWLGASILELPFRIIHFGDAMISFLNLLIWWLGIGVGYFFFKVRKITHKIIFVGLSLICALWISTSGYGMWTHKLNYGTINGHVYQECKSEIKMQNYSGEYISLNELDKAYLLLDMWYTSCRVCYEQFPKLQEMYEKYKDEDRVGIYAVHCRTEYEKYNIGYVILSTRSYEFPSLSLDNNDEIIEEWGILRFPMVFILDKQRNIIYKGDLAQAESYLARLLDKLS
ncbi:TlpA family protein disulfide reductase [Alistipes sp. kh20]|uniref:TlpA family protein disulfide reductase n=1 Tax=Alistipes montrealensis TaxID=2834113 RepID=UPI001BCC27AD|nr:TlpA disulfide reductase family protein [Alistipes montrealensis]MBS4764632.1 TlpA family protein disulfide reductase [Alistipes montrealensis]